jgi:hypothetical protein
MMSLAITGAAADPYRSAKGTWASRQAPEAHDPQEQAVI